MIIEARIAIVSFCACILANLFFGLLRSISPLDIPLSGLVLLNILINLFICFTYRRKLSIALRSTPLGSIFGLGLLLTFSSLHHIRTFGIYIIFLSFFHWSEYVSVALTNPSSLKLDSFLLDHSVQYWIAASASWTEYFFSQYFFPDQKLFGYLSFIGIFLCVSGEILRKTAMFTAGSGFTHLISYRKRDSHQLVRHGVYAYMRHPSYLGWFMWSIGTQFVLANPVCAIVYFVVSWRFFNERIYDEEITLLNFFGEEYVRYQREVWSGIPFVRGFRGDV